MYRFETVCKIVDNEEVLGYKIQHTFSVFYVSPGVLEDGIKQGIIFSFDEQSKFSINDIDILEYSDLGMEKGRVGQKRFKQAVEEITLDKLKEAIEHNKRYEVLTIEITESDKVIRRYNLIPEKDIIYSIYNSRKQLLKIKFNSIFELVNFMVSIKDKEYMNIKDVIEYIDKDKTESSNVYSFKVEIE